MIQKSKYYFSDLLFYPKLDCNKLKRKIINSFFKKKASASVTRVCCHGTLIILTLLLSYLYLTEKGITNWLSYFTFSSLLLFVYYLSQTIIKLTNKTHPIFFISIHLIIILIPSLLAIFIFSPQRIYFPVLNEPNVTTVFKFVFFCTSFLSVYMAGLVIIFLLRNLKYVEVNKILLTENEKTRMNLLRMQMNPHFVYNCLVNLNDTIRSGNNEKAIKYNNALSILLRSQLEHSEKEKISLQKEIEWLDVYIKAETYRTPELFDFKINYLDVDIEELEIPPMLLQPFIENSIKHVFLPSSEKGLLEICITQTSTAGYNIKIKDSGDGTSRKNSTHYIHQHKSVSVKNIKERIKILNEISSFYIYIDTKVLVNGFEVSLDITQKNKIKSSYN